MYTSYDTIDPTKQPINTHKQPINTIYGSTYYPSCIHHIRRHHRHHNLLTPINNLLTPTSDGTIDPTGIVEAYAKAARTRGAVVAENGKEGGRRNEWRKSKECLPAFFLIFLLYFPPSSFLLLPFFPPSPSSLLPPPPQHLWLPSKRKITDLRPSPELSTHPK